MVWVLDLSRLEHNRQALNERQRSHDRGGKLRLSCRAPARKGSQQQGFDADLSPALGAQQAQKLPVQERELL